LAVVQPAFKIFESLSRIGFKLIEGSLPDDWRARYRAAEEVGEVHQQRVLSDFIAGMTDRYAIRFHSAIAGEDGLLARPVLTTHFGAALHQQPDAC
jgi:dGTPase